MDSTSALVYGSVWLALLCYPAGAFGFVTTEDKLRRLAKWIWSLGCTAFALHALSAYGLVYQWSNAVALRETAKQTEALTGFNSGLGLYLNFLFAVLWCLDAARWWSNPEAYFRRSNRSLLWFHGFFLFMILNGAVIFVSSPRRWLGLTITLTGAIFLWRALRRPRIP